MTAWPTNFRRDDITHNADGTRNTSGSQPVQRSAAYHEAYAAAERAARQREADDRREAARREVAVDMAREQAERDEREAPYKAYRASLQAGKCGGLAAPSRTDGEQSPYERYCASLTAGRCGIGT